MNQREIAQRRRKKNVGRNARCGRKVESVPYMGVFEPHQRGAPCGENRDEAYGKEDDTVSQDGKGFTEGRRERIADNLRRTGGGMIPGGSRVEQDFGNHSS